MKLRVLSCIVQGLCSALPVRWGLTRGCWVSVAPTKEVRGLACMVQGQCHPAREGEGEQSRGHCHRLVEGGSAAEECLLGAAPLWPPPGGGAAAADHGPCWEGGRLRAASSW